MKSHVWKKWGYSRLDLKSLLGEIGFLISNSSTFLSKYISLHPCLLDRLRDVSGLSLAAGSKKKLRKKFIGIFTSK